MYCNNRGKSVFLTVVLLMNAVFRVFGQNLPELVAQMGHSLTIESVAFSPDGRFVLSGSTDQTLKLWDVANGKEVRTFSGHSGIVNSVAFSPDGRFILSGSFDQALKLWDVASGKEVRTYSGHSSIVNSVAFSPDGRFILSGSLDGTLKLWETASGKVVRTLSGHSHSVQSVVFSPDGRFVLSGSFDRTLKLWEVATGKEVRTISANLGMIDSVAFSPDGRYISGSSLDKLALWEAASGKAVWSINANIGTHTSIAFSPDGRFIVSVSPEDGLKLWHAESGKRVSTFLDDPSGPVNAVAFSPDGRFVISGSTNYELQLWEMASGRSIRTFSGLPAYRFGSAVFSPDGRYILIGAYNGSINLHELTLREVASWKEVRTFSGDTDSSHGIFSPDGRFVLSLSAENGTPNLLEVASGKIVRTYTGKASYDCLAFSPDGRYVLAGSSSDSSDALKLWETASGKVVRTFSVHPNGVNSVAFSPNGRLIITADGSAGSLRLWEVASGKKILTFRGHSNYVTSVAFSPNGRFVLSGSTDDTLKLWDVASGKEVRTYSGHSSNVNCVAFSPNGRFILSGSLDGTLKLWETASGNVVRTLSGHFRGIDSVAFSPDGRFVLSCAMGTPLRLWDLVIGHWVAFSVNVDMKQWLLFTDDGYWDGSRNCGELVAMVRGTEVWNIDQFAVRNNRPDIILERLGNSDRALLGHYTALWRKRLRRLGLREPDLATDFTVPEARIVSRRQEGKVFELEIVLASPNRPLSRYQVYANDVPLFGAAGKQVRGESASVKERVELTPGENKIEVSCMDAGGSESFRSSVMVRYDIPRDAPPPDLYYLAFGVSEYADPEINDLGYAAKDAKDLESAFRVFEETSYTKVHSRVYTDAQVTRQSVLAAKAFLETARPEDTFVLFISGHGVQEESPEEETKAGAEKGHIVPGEAREYTYYYVTSDARLRDLASTAVDFESIEDLLQGIGPRQKLFLMDTCQSGEVEEDVELPPSALSGARGLKARALTPGKARTLAQIPSAVAKSLVERDRYIYNDLVRRSGAIVFSSSRGSESSLEADEWQQGAFTYKILEALRQRAADADGDGLVSTEELRAYVIAEVPKLTEGLQHPTVDRDNIYSRFGF